MTLCCESVWLALPATSQDRRLACAEEAAEQANARCQRSVEEGAQKTPEAGTEV